MTPDEQRRNDALTAAAAAARTARSAQRDIEHAVAAGLRSGATWSQIATALGVTRQTAHQRYRHLRSDPTTGRSWTEPPLPL